MLVCYWYREKARDSLPCIIRNREVSILTSLKGIYAGEEDFEESGHLAKKALLDIPETDYFDVTTKDGVLILRPVTVKLDRGWPPYDRRSKISGLNRKTWRQAIEYFLSPLLKLAKESIRER